MADRLLLQTSITQVDIVTTNKQGFDNSHHYNANISTKIYGA